MEQVRTGNGVDGEHLGPLRGVDPEASAELDRELGGIKTVEVVAPPTPEQEDTDKVRNPSLKEQEERREKARVEDPPANGGEPSPEARTVAPEVPRKSNWPAYVAGAIALLALYAAWHYHGAEGREHESIKAAATNAAIDAGHTAAVKESGALFKNWYENNWTVVKKKLADDISRINQQASAAEAEAKSADRTAREAKRATIDVRRELDQKLSKAEVPAQVRKALIEAMNADPAVQTALRSWLMSETGDLAASSGRTDNEVKALMSRVQKLEEGARPKPAPRLEQGVIGFTGVAKPKKR